MPSQASQSVVLGDRYEVSTPLGSGSAANVFRVRDRRTGAMRAAKILKPENAANARVLARFEDEFRILRTLHHPHLPEVYDYGWTDDGGRYLIMELVDGVPLDEFFRSNPDDIWPILYELCETLTFVHNHKLLHQDIKPSNILVRRTTAFGPDLPLIKLIDFGLTYRRDAGAAVEFVGTPEYMAPEVVRGDPSLTRAVDYYSLGVTLYELLCGRPPFVGPESEVLRAHLQREPVIEEEELEWAELYPHVRALLTKNWRARLEAFEELRRAVTSRLTGGIEELDRAYGLARIDSLPMIGKEEVWREVLGWLGNVVKQSVEDPKKQARVLEIRARRGAGRSRLIDALRAEAAVRGLHILQLGSDANGDLLATDGQKLRQVDRFDRVIGRFDGAHLTAALLIIDGIERLNDDEAAFIRYLSTKRELAAGGGTALFHVVARDWGPIDQSLDSYLPPDRQSVRLLVDTEVAGERGGDDLDRARVLASAVLDSELSDTRRLLLAYCALHPAAVPIEWAMAFAGSATDIFDKDLDQLATVHLVRRVVVAGVDSLMASDDVRTIARELVSSKDRERIHCNFIDRLSRQDELVGLKRSSIHELIACHYESIGEQRSALVSRVRALRAALVEGSLANVEQLAQSSLRAIAELNGSYAKAARHYFAKQWVKALWARNQHTRAKQVIDDHILKYGEVVPASLLPKYVRSILDAEGPALAFEFLDGIAFERLPVVTNQQLLLERALLLCQSARHEESLALLKRLSSSRTLSRRDCYRVTIYRAMNLVGLGALDQIEDLLRNASDRARADGCNDEFVLMSAIRVQARTAQGRPQDSLRIIAQTLPVAQRHEFYFRLNVLYRLAASAYQDLGQPRKAILSQQKAIALASALGLPQFEAMSWIRLSEYERVLGNFGNVIRYLNKASAVMAKSSYEADRARLNLAEIQIHAWLRSPDTDRAIDNASWIEGIKDASERGRFFVMLGGYWADTEDWDRAKRCYDRATEILQRAGFVDNLIVLSRARLRLALRSGRTRQAEQARRAINARTLRIAGSTSGQLERNLALLEFAFLRRANWKVVSGLCEACLHLSDESTEAIGRLEALSLVFRAYARYNKYVEAEAAFRQFFALLKSATGNLDDRYVAGLMDRLDWAQLTREYALMEKRNKAGVATSLVA